MTFLEELSRVAPPKEAAVTIGVFDGMHLGHQHLLARLKAEAAQRGLIPIVLTFPNHPRTVLRPEERVSLLTTWEERQELLRSQGVAQVIALEFTRELSWLRPREFLGLLRQHLKLATLVEGPDFALGYQRQGDLATLRALGQEMGFELVEVEPYCLKGQTVSSTLIRNLISTGDVGTVARMLGRNFALRGVVVRGDGRGRDLGFPTANLAVPDGLAVPANGIYATWAHVDGSRFPSATSIGVRPTFGSSQRTIESYLMDFRGLLYSKDLKLEFVRRLRDEVAFSSPEALVRQMEQDVSQAREVLALGER